MNDVLFNVIALTATAGFLLGVVQGWLPMIMISIILAGLLYWGLKRLP